MIFPAFPGVKVYLAAGVTDLRKSINGLFMLVADYLELDAFSGHLFAFCNRKRDMVKVLYWDRNGFCLRQMDMNRTVTSDSFLKNYLMPQNLKNTKPLLPWNVNPQKLAIEAFNTRGIMKRL